MGDSGRKIHPRPSWPPDGVKRIYPGDTEILPRIRTLEKILYHSVGMGCNDLLELWGESPLSERTTNPSRKCENEIVYDIEVLEALKCPRTNFFKSSHKYFRNFFEVPLQIFAKIIWNFRTVSYFQKLLWKCHKVSIKMLFLVWAKGFLYFLKVFLKFLRSSFPVSLKLFQKNFLKFLHNINIIFELLQFFQIMFP